MAMASLKDAVRTDILQGLLSTSDVDNLTPPESKVRTSTFSPPACAETEKEPLFSRLWSSGLTLSDADTCSPAAADSDVHDTEYLAGSKPAEPAAESGLPKAERSEQIAKQSVPAAAESAPSKPTELGAQQSVPAAESAPSKPTELGAEQSVLAAESAPSKLTEPAAESELTAEGPKEEGVMEATDSETDRRRKSDAAKKPKAAAKTQGKKAKGKAKSKVQDQDQDKPKDSKDDEAWSFHLSCMVIFFPVIGLVASDQQFGRCFL